jgi:putative nucleotidyltransferase with HDIG domain
MDYLPIRVSTIRGDQKIDFDAFVKINEKYVLYLRRGDSFEGGRLDRLKGKKLRKMFIVENDEPQYRQYLTRNIEMAFDKNSSASIENRAQIIQGNQQSQGEEVMENPGDENAYSEAKNSASRFVEFLSGEDSAFQHIMSIDNVDQNIAHHGVTVSTLAVALAKRLGLVDPKQTQLLSLGALLHDFGHFNSPLAINRPISEFTPAELEIYKNHPLEGREKVLDKKHFDASVINIITQHEEYIDGRGFPNGLVESKTDPLAVITASANALDRLITFEGVPKKDAVKKLMIESVGKHPLNHIQFLGDVMNKMKF